jgi:hypothetical protein
LVAHRCCQSSPTSATPHPYVVEDVPTPKAGFYTGGCDECVYLALLHCRFTVGMVPTLALPPAKHKSGYRANQVS